MFIKRAGKTNRAWTIAELVVATGIFSLASIACMSLYMFSIRSFASMANYATLDEVNRQAMDQLTREIRQAKLVTDCSTNPPTIKFINGDGLNVTYRFDSQYHQMIREASDGSRKVLVKNCSLLSFSLCQRNPIDGTYNIYPAATNNWKQTVKVIQLTWKAARTIPNGINSENVQTARVVIRKQQDN